MDITFGSTADALYATALTLTRSLGRGDFDDDPEFSDAVASVASRCRESAETADGHGQTYAEVSVDGEHLDEMLAILEDGPHAHVRRFVTDASAALASAGHPGSAEASRGAVATSGGAA